MCVCVWVCICIYIYMCVCVCVCICVCRYTNASLPISVIFQARDTYSGSVLHVRHSMTVRVKTPYCVTDPELHLPIRIAERAPGDIYIYIYVCMHALMCIYVFHYSFNPYCVTERTRNYSCPFVSPSAPQVIYIHMYWYINRYISIHIYICVCV